MLLFNTGSLYRLLRSEARRLGIRWSALMVLRDLTLLGPLSQRELAGIEQLRPATLSVLVKELLVEDLVSRGPDAQDRRAVKVGITAAGRTRLEHDSTCLAQILNEELESLGDTALTEFLRGERHLARMLGRRPVQ